MGNMARIDSFLKLVVEQRASDLYIISNSRPIIRYNGELSLIRYRRITENEAKRFLYEILSPELQDRFEKTLDLDLSYDIPDVGRFRVNMFKDSNGMGAVFRIIPAKVKSIDDLELPTTLKKFAYLDNGLVLVTGPSGSGKTTTLAAIIRELNYKRKKHIITIEDPIEYIQPTLKSVISQREVGTHTQSFHSALRSALRESPDVILVGELRDIETISLAMTCAETGALIFGTLHTLSCSKTVDRIIDVFPKDSQAQIRTMLSINLKGVVSQRLVKNAEQTGRIAVVEILMGSIALSNLIRENKTFQINNLMQSGQIEETGSQTMDQALLKLLKSNRIHWEDVRTMIDDPTIFHEYLN